MVADSRSLKTTEVVVPNPLESLGRGKGRAEGMGFKKQL